jgi:glycosyltransferase involved in cell wall biosynthesis
MLTAISLVPENLDAKLVLCGQFETQDLEKAAGLNTGWARVQFLGWQPREEVARVYSSVKAGLVMFHPGPNHNEALPAKLFEYMAAGLPLVASNFPLWRRIIDDARCGLVVDPLNPQEISQAITFLLTHPREAQGMGNNGQRAAQERYNWATESTTLLHLYAKLSQ